MTKSLGEQLQSIRESREISLEEIAQKTHIRIEYLKALESGDTEHLPSGPQRRGFLKLYASQLGVEVDGTNVKGFQAVSETQEPEQQALEDQESGSQKEPSPPALPKEEVSQEDTSPQVEEAPEPPQNTGADTLETQLGEVDAGYLPDQSARTRSSQVFSQLGDTLRQRRELLSLSIEDIHEHIHIRMNFLNAMEAGNFGKLPSPVQARGMLANYADFLNLDVDKTLLQYADALQMQRLERTESVKAEKPQQKKTLSTTRLRLKNFFSLDLLVIAALFIGIAAFVIWGVSRILAVNATGTSPTDIPEVAEVLLATGSPTPQDALTLETAEAEQDLTGTPAPEEPTPIFTPFPNDNPINIVIIPRQRVWVRVIADEEMVFEGRMLPGNAYDFSGEENLEVLTGSAGALQIYFNEQDIGAPGLVGQVVNLIFTEEGLVLPTPTNTPTVTETPEETLTPTPTLTPSQTLQPSATPTDSND